MANKTSKKKKRAVKKKTEPDVYMINNMEVHKKEGYVIVSVNPRIYSLDILYSAAYVLLDKAYLIIDGDPNEEILIEIRPRENGLDLETLGRELNNELINYAVYKLRSDRNKNIRNAIVQRAFDTNNVCDQKGSDNEEIAVPWDKTNESD